MKSPRRIGLLAIVVAVLVLVTSVPSFANAFSLFETQSVFFYTCDSGPGAACAATWVAYWTNASVQSSYWYGYQYLSQQWASTSVHNNYTNATFAFQAVPYQNNYHSSSGTTVVPLSRYTGGGICNTGYTCTSGNNGNFVTPNPPSTMMSSTTMWGTNGSTIPSWGLKTTGQYSGF